MLGFDPNMLAFIQNLGVFEMVAIALVALLLFGRRLPEVGRSLGKGIVEFKKGLKDTTDEITNPVDESKSADSHSSKTDDKK